MIDRAATRRDVLKAATGLTVAGSLAGCTRSIARNMPSSKVVGGPDDLRSELTVYLYAPDNGGEAGGKMLPFMFRPMVGYVEPGTEVRWEHAGEGSVLHSVTAFGGNDTDPRLIPDGAQAWNSGPFAAKKDPYTHTFEEPGVYAYYCMPHKDFGMSGLMVVGDVGPGDPGWSPAMTKPLDQLDLLAPKMKMRLKKFRRFVRNGGVPKKDRGGVPGGDA